MAIDSRVDVRQRLGARLRAVRQTLGWSLREAGQKAGLSHNFIRLVENGASEIAVSRLLRLADVYGIVVADLLGDVHDPEVELVRRDARFDVPSANNDVRVSYLSSPSWKLQAFLLELEGGAMLASREHPGEEFLFCVSGILEMEIGERCYLLRSGDSLVLPGRVEHTYRNKAKRPVRTVGVFLVPHHVTQERPTFDV